MGNFKERKVKFIIVERKEKSLVKILPISERLVDDMDEEICNELATRASYNLGFNSRATPKKAIKWRCLETKGEAEKFEPTKLISKYNERIDMNTIENKKRVMNLA